MRKAFGAILAFNFYSLTLVWAFMTNTVYFFEPDVVQNFQKYGLSVPEDYMWGDHYIWRLIVSIIVTALAGFLAGAIAKKKGGLISALANIPSVITWGGLVYILLSYPEDYPSQTGYLIISILAIPVTTFIAYLFGRIGEQTQEEGFDEKTVFGIRPFHFIWIFIPLYPYSIGLVHATGVLVKTLMMLWGDMSIISSFIYLLGLIPVAIWLLPLGILYAILTNEILSGMGKIIKSLASCAILIFGFIIAVFIERWTYMLLGKIVNWWC
jgi:hypothetical protein